MSLVGVGFFCVVETSESAAREVDDVGERDEDADDCGRRGVLVVQRDAGDVLLDVEGNVLAEAREAVDGMVARAAVAGAPRRTEHFQRSERHSVARHRKGNRRGQRGRGDGEEAEERPAGVGGVGVDGGEVDVVGGGRRKRIVQETHAPERRHRPEEALPEQELGGLDVAAAELAALRRRGQVRARVDDGLAVVRRRDAKFTVEFAPAEKLRPSLLAAGVRPAEGRPDRRGVPDEGAAAAPAVRVVAPAEEPKLPVFVPEQRRVVHQVSLECRRQTRRLFPGKTAQARVAAAPAHQHLPRLALCALRSCLCRGGGALAEEQQRAVGVVVVREETQVPDRLVPLRKRVHHGFLEQGLLPR
mmetsp:Transcript_9040/g.27733  ORF Transcript_9040/g.27733 Transcript_9040/m.27733 type:complete len:359 (-) Transcript_9040:57-1133(-)